jgi:hypothetical protein
VVSGVGGGGMGVALWDSGTIYWTDITFFF